MSCLQTRVPGFGSRISGSGDGVPAVGLRVPGSSIQDSDIGVLYFGFRVSGSGIRVSAPYGVCAGVGFRVLNFQVPGSGFQVLGVWFPGSGPCGCWYRAADFEYLGFGFRGSSSGYRASVLEVTGFRVSGFGFGVPGGVCAGR